MTKKRARRTTVLPFLGALILVGSASLGESSPASSSVNYKGQRRKRPGVRRIQQVDQEQQVKTNDEPRQQLRQLQSTSKKGAAGQPRPHTIKTTALKADSQKSDASRNKVSKSAFSSTKKSKKSTAASMARISKLRKSAPSASTSSADSSSSKTTSSKHNSSPSKSPKQQTMTTNKSSTGDAGQPRPYASAWIVHNEDAVPSMAPLSTPSGPSLDDIDKDDDLVSGHNKNQDNASQDNNSEAEDNDPLKANEQDNADEEEEDDGRVTFVIRGDHDDDDNFSSADIASSGGTIIAIYPDDDYYYFNDDDNNDDTDDDSQTHKTAKDSDDDDDDDDDHSSADGTLITIIDENDPTGIFDCQVATELEINMIQTVEKENLRSDLSHVEDYCDDNWYSSFRPRDYELGGWYNLVGTGEWLRITACPAKISIYEGNDCANLVCTNKVARNDKGCQVEWETEKGKLYYVLLHGTDRGFRRDISLEVEELGAPSEDGYGGVIVSVDENFISGSRDDNRPGPGRDSFSQDENTASGSRDDDRIIVSGSRDEDSTLVEECKNNAIPAVIGGTTTGDFTFTLDHDFGPCDIGFHQRRKIDKMDTSEGAWFTVDGQGKVLRVSSCPFQLSVFSDNCGDLECIEDGQYTNALKCEFEWKNPIIEDVVHILVQSTVAGDKRRGPVELQVDDIGPRPSKPNQSPSSAPNIRPTLQNPTTVFPVMTLNPVMTAEVVPSNSPTRKQSKAPSRSPIPGVASSNSPTRKPSKAPSRSPIPEVAPSISPTTRKPSKAPSRSPISDPDTDAPTFKAPKPPVPVPESSQPETRPPIPFVTSSPTITIAPTDDDEDDVHVEQCRTNSDSVVVGTGVTISSEFLFPLGEDFVNCDLAVSPAKRVPIRATWISVVGDGSILEADSCPYQASVFTDDTDDCSDLLCRDTTYSDARFCKFQWQSPNDGTRSRVLVQSTVSGIPESGDLSFTLSIKKVDEAGPSVSPGETSVPSIQSLSASPSIQSQSPGTVTPTASQALVSPTPAPSQTQIPLTRDPTEAPTLAQTEVLTESPTKATTQTPTEATTSNLTITSSPTTVSTLFPTTAMPSEAPTVVVTTTIDPSTLGSVTEMPTLSAIQTEQPSDVSSILPPTGAPTTETTLPPSQQPTSAVESSTFSPTNMTTSPTLAPILNITVTPTAAINETLVPTVVATNITLFPSSSPSAVIPTKSSAPTITAPLNDECPGALTLNLGDTIETTTEGANEVARGLDTCFRRDIGGSSVARPGIWYSIDVRPPASSSERLRLSACNGTEAETAPVQLTLYESDNSGCDVLICANTINHLGCSLEFSLPSATPRQTEVSYKLLVEQIITSDALNGGGTFPLSFGVTQVPGNDECVQSQYLEVGATIQGNTQSATPETPEVVALCDRENGDLLERIGKKDPAPGVWYRMFVGGRVGLLASACSSARPDLVHVTVYQGTCNDLQCLSDVSLSSSACETMWEATSSESVYFILVERVLEDGNDEGDFSLSVDILYR